MITRQATEVSRQTRQNSSMAKVLLNLIACRFKCDNGGQSHRKM
jgi:hypothetical protein